MSRRKGTPCACECDPCGSKKCIKAINNVSGDPNGDFEIVAGNGIGISQSGDNQITIINQGMASSFVAGDNIEINPSGDDLEIRVTDDVSIDNLNMSGDLNIAGDIIQQGAAYETHAEKIYTTNDYIYMREGAVGGLASGSYAGFEVIKYDGVNDGRLVIDNSGTARVGDVGSEQPLLTREESANLNNGALLKWDSANFKAVNEGTIGNDTKPLKSVGGVLTPVANELQTKLTPSTVSNFATAGTNVTITQVSFSQYGKLIIAGVEILTGATIPAGQSIITINSAYAPRIREWFCLNNVSRGVSHSASVITNGQVQATSNLYSGEYHIIRLSYLIA